MMVEAQAMDNDATVGWHRVVDWSLANKCLELRVNDRNSMDWRMSNVLEDEWRERREWRTRKELIQLLTTTWGAWDERSSEEQSAMEQIQADGRERPKTNLTQDN